MSCILPYLDTKLDACLLVASAVTYARRSSCSNVSYGKHMQKKYTRIVTYNNKRCISENASPMQQLAWHDLATLGPVLQPYVTWSICQH